jgi:serine/threonine protein kinase
MDDYEILEQIGQGAYGQVFKALHRPTKQLRALKRIRMDGERDGFPVTASRELKLLQQMTNPRILTLIGIERGHVQSVPENVKESPRSSSTAPEFWIIFKWYDNDLAGIVSKHRKLGQKLPIPFIRHLLRQLLDGIAYLHSNNIVHRDLKPSNLLVSSDGDLSIADFGLARMLPFDPNFSETSEKFILTNRVATLWYRAPELLLGSSLYGGEIDIWSVGCIAHELVFLEPFLVSQNGTELGQIDEVMSFFEAASYDPSFLHKCPWYPAFADCRLTKKFLHRSTGDAQLDDFIIKCLHPVPSNRVTALKALQHPFFTDKQNLFMSSSGVPLVGMHDYAISKHASPKI